MATEPQMLEQRRLLIKADTLTHQAREDFTSFGLADDILIRNVKLAVHSLNQFLKNTNEGG